MRIGAHVSIRGGLHKAPYNAQSIGCECFQIFSRSPRGGPARPIAPAAARRFRRACDAAGQSAWYLHTPYYVNLASGDERIAEMSVGVVRYELERGRAIGARAVVTHMGSAGTDGAETAMERAVNNIRRVLTGYAGRTRLLVENAAGSGAIVGRSLFELSRVVRATRGRCGVCLDSQHMFASGYDIRNPRAVRETFDEFDRTLGIRHLRLVHVNDSKVPFASGKDRHEHIGAGAIGEKGFRALLGEPRLRDIDMILETRTEGAARDVRALKLLRDRGK